MRLLDKIFFRLRNLFPLFFFIPFFPQDLLPQGNDIQFTHLTTEDGLSLNVVTKILQDKRGFLWFGTYNGLNRYDGYNFKTYVPQPSAPDGISDQSIQTLFEDSKGYLWIGTNDGLNKYDYSTEKFTVYKNIPDDPYSLSHNAVRAVFEDRDGTLWIGTIDGLNRYNRTEDHFLQIKKVSDEYNERSENSVWFIYEDDKENIWLGVWNGLSCLKKDGQIVKYNLPGLYEYNPASYFEISSIIQDKENLWIGTANRGLFQYNLATGKTRNFKNNRDDFYSISSDYINTIYIDRLKNLWVGTENGLNKFNRENSSFIRFQNDLFKPLSIVNNQVHTICEDKTGLIWVGTSGGVSKFSQSVNMFFYYKENKVYPENGLSSSIIGTIKVDKNDNIWIGTQNGLDVIYNKTGEVVHYRNDPQKKNRSINNNTVTEVLIDRSGIVWIGTNGGGLNKYNPSTGYFDFFVRSRDPNSLSANGVISLCQDYKGNLWVGTWNGLNYLDTNSGNFTRYLSDSKNTNSIKNNLIWVIFEDSRKLIWIGTDAGGVSCYYPKTKTFKNFVSDSSNADNIAGNKVVSIYETSDGILWFGTTKGLSSYSIASGKFKNFNIEDGLPSMIINGIIEDEKGFLWISTDKGLTKFDRKKSSFSNFTKRNGLKDTEFSIDAVAKSSQNILYFGGKYSVVYFNPDKINDEYIPAPVTFTDLKIFNQSVPVSNDGSTLLRESITTSSIIEIPYNSSDIVTIEFALLDFHNVKANTFRYKLSGFDDRWNNMGSKNNATYTNLPPGDYTFYVRAINNNDKRSEKEASIKFIIIPNYYQTAWFKLFVGITIFFIIVLFVQLRTRAIKKQNKLLENYVHARTKDLQTSLQEKETLLCEKEILLKEIHHRVKNNLQIISSLLYLNSKKLNNGSMLDTFRVSQNRIKSIALVHERLYQSKDLAKINFKEYVQRLTNDLFSSYAVDRSLIAPDLEIENISISVDSAVPFGLIINELISNSLKHAFPNYEEEKKSGLIKITFRRNENGEYILEVSDNGAGIPEDFEERKKNSLGLQLIETLVAQLEAVLEIKYSPGTLFRINFKNDKGIL